MAGIEEMTKGRSAREVLAWSRSLVDPALRVAVDTLPPPTRGIIGYHFGWWDQHGRVTQADSGKALRPALVLLASEAVNGAPEAAVPAAVAVELVHNFSLLHDDVMDGDLTRRHRATAWSVFGNSAAILAGDALLTLAFDVIAASGAPVAGEGVRMLSAAVLDLVAGQSADMALEQRVDADLTECLGMVRKKTGALLGCSCAIGGLFGGGGTEQMNHLGGFGERLGMAFQLIDDLLGIWGDPAVTGKSAHSDLYNRKKSIPVIAALTSGTPAGTELGALYHRDQALTAADLARAAELIAIAGGRDWTQSRADGLMAEALHHLRSADPPPRPAAELTAMARLVTRRDH